MSGTLFVVATPIGNLEDISIRALRILREADGIAAEDTRRTAKLLAHYAISTPTISFHQHNARSRLPQLLARLGRGEGIALVTDAGTPGVSDPGIELVRACVEAGIAVDPIPGPSAPVTAAAVSGFPLEPLTILGFVPARSKDRISWLERVKSIPHTVVFFEAPHRIRRTMADMDSVLGIRQIVVARELTKMHQELLRSHRAGDLIDQMPNPKGEFTVVVGPTGADESSHNRPNDQSIAAEFGRMTDSLPGGRRQIVAALARKHGLSPNDVYAIIEKEKSSGV
ncbi:MAG: 16S rRNA (cytidine(1402)-2'-O)-methyltransferase [Acidobacteria bacterium RIFCSPLOWO2_12_FULL_67_14]|nr:MAG: 16S rRNA (cytidine(1402)-2'-O)-methyltransferase [Acidobacteria bacterium RIFCSPLOWO2_02_FULL_67_21]OFW35245.1 MAG: 16S rRNA (cytidine(1402)-2'-O)-methyltransferase [Acidobacteria bacterium RIFCSPLOWO2_12_FULL_67_14]